MASSIIFGARNTTFGEASKKHGATDCSICLKEWNSSDKVKELACKHLYCTPCLEEAMRKSNNKCPLCRNPQHLDEAALDEIGASMRNYSDCWARVDRNNEIGGDPENGEDIREAMRASHRFSASHVKEWVRVRGTDEQKQSLEQLEEDQRNCERRCSLTGYGIIGCFGALLAVCIGSKLYAKIH